VDLSNPFLQSLGTNGRTCVTCHDADDGWSITPERIVARLQAAGGADPLFRNNDGSNCEGVLTASVTAPSPRSARSSPSTTGDSASA
jgi:hypothetical protein